MIRRLVLMLVILIFPLMGQQEGHRVRFRNDFNRSIVALEVGNLHFENIGPNAETDYQVIDGGHAQIKGKLAGQGMIYLDGGVSFPLQRPYRQYTLILKADRRFRLEEEAQQKTEEVVRVPRERMRVRFENRFSEKIIKVSVGPVTFYNVPTGSTSEYRLLPPGIYTILMEIQGFDSGAVAGEIEIPALPNHRFSIVLDERGIITVREDL